MIQSRKIGDIIMKKLCYDYSLEKKRELCLELYAKMNDFYSRYIIDCFAVH